MRFVSFATRSSATPPTTDVSQGYTDAVERLLGGERPLRFVDQPKKGFFARMFGG